MFPKILLLTLFVIALTAERLNETIYIKLSSIKACFRRLNGTMEFGCTSEFSGNVGVLRYIDSEDVSSVENDQFAPYIILLSPEVFSGRMMNKLKNTGNVNGIILPGTKEGRWKGKFPPEQSDDSVCPNRNSGIYTDNEDQCGSVDSPWNPAGEDVLWTNWDFPIFLINDGNTTEDIYQCYEDFNSGPDATWPLCSVELKSPMYAAKDSETCFRRSNFIATLTPQQYCEPLSDYNLHYALSPRNGTAADGSVVTQKNDSVVLVVARLDALNIFDKEEVGFDSPTTGIVTLMAAAQAVKRAVVSGYRQGIENIMFMLVHGESLDYIGSNRMVYDMMKDEFPYKLSQDLQDNGIWKNGTQPLLKLEHIRYIIELGQLANTKSNRIYYHTHNKNNDIADLIRFLSESPIRAQPSSRRALPPSSAHSFLKKRPDIPVLLLTNYDTRYENPFFHSIYDNAMYHGYRFADGNDQKIVVQLSNVADAVAGALVASAVSTTSKPSVNRTAVNAMLECYAETQNCSLYRDVATPNGHPYKGKVSNEPFPQYISVMSSFHTEMTKQMLQYFTGDVVNDAEQKKCNTTDECAMKCVARNKHQLIYRYKFLVGPDCHNATGGPYCGVCYRTTVHEKMARSPAFEPDTWKTYDWTSKEFPTWTESYWKSISGRIFLQPSPANQHTTLAVGIIVAFLSFPLTYWLQRKSRIIFLSDGAGGLQPDGQPTAPVAL